MTITLGILSLILSLISAMYLQIPTFILAVGYRWAHNYPIKRWIFRIAALITFLLFIYTDPKLWIILSFGIPFTLFWIFSTFNANPNVFISLNEHLIIKQKDSIYPDDTEMVGYLDGTGEAICYPIYAMVMPRHLLNDIFCDKPIAVTFCAGCRSTMIYNPVIDGQRLTFDVLAVYRRNMIIMDNQTGTVWQQATGEAMYGKLKGKQLEYYPYQQTTLIEWKLEHPNTYIAKESDKVRKSFMPKSRLMKMLKITETMIPPGKADLTGLSVREKIWGLEINGKSKAYPIFELKKIKEITDNLGGVEIEIHYNPKNNIIHGVISTTNEQLKFQNHWWFGWKEFHPETEIWKGK